MTTEVFIPTNDIPSIKKAARELGVDFVDGEVREMARSIIFLIDDPYLLIAIGTLAGIERYYQSVKGPMREIFETVEQKIKKATDDSQLG